MMNDRSTLTRIRIASGINVLSGLYLLCLPWTLHYIAADPSAALGSVAIGALMAIIGFVRISSPRRMAALSVINLALGFWTLISPWVYGFTLEAARTWSSVLIGIIVMLCAAWSATMTIYVQREHTV